MNTLDQPTHHGPWCDEEGATPCSACSDPAYRLYCIQSEADYVTPYGRCPEDGWQRVLRTSSTGGPDPYEQEHLECGHSVIGFGPGDDAVVSTSSTQRFAWEGLCADRAVLLVKARHALLVTLVWAVTA